MKLPMRPSKQSGFAHLALLIIVAVVIGVTGFIGYTIYQKSDADAALGKLACDLRGRKWNTSAKVNCLQACKSNKKSDLVRENGHNWCKGYVSNGINSKKCIDLGRRYLNTSGCARRPKQDSKAKAPQCRGNKNYYVSSPYDYCATKKKSGGGVASAPSKGGWTWPVPGHRGINQSWGNYYAPKKGKHKGIDINAGAGTRVVAAHYGRVVKRTADSGCGGYLVIRTTSTRSNGTRNYAAYQHVRGQTGKTYVNAGERVAEVGNGGSRCGTGNHLHFSIESGNRVSEYAHPWPNGTVNPFDYL